MSVVPIHKEEQVRVELLQSECVLAYEEGQLELESESEDACP